MSVVLRLYALPIQDARCLAFSPDGSKLFVGDASAELISIWDVRTQSCLGRLLPHDEPCLMNHITVSPDGKSLGYGTQFGGMGTVGLAGNTSCLKLTDPPATDEADEWGGPDYNINAVDFSGDGKLIATCGDDGLVRLWSAETGDLLQRASLRDETGIWMVYFIASDHHLVTQGSEGVFIWTLEPLEPIRRLELQEPFAFGRTIAATTTATGEAISLLDSSSGIERGSLRPGGNVTALAFSPDNRMLAINTDDHGIICWDVASDSIIAEGDSVSVPLVSLAARPMHPGAAALTEDGDVLLWLPVTALEFPY